MDEIQSITQASIPNKDAIKVDHENNSELEVKGQGFFSEKFYKLKILDGKEFTKIAKAIEKLIRTSEEYKTFIFNIFEDLNIHGCSILGNVGEDDDLATIEIDHYPFTLYDIVAAVMNKHIETENKFNTFMIADEVMKLHYDMKVGIVPLSITMHQLRHSGKIFVNLKQVIGNYLQFARDYESYIDPDTIATLAKLMELSRDNAPISNDPSFLEIKAQHFYKDAIEAPTLAIEDITNKDLSHETAN